MTQTVEELFGCIATQFGIATGEAIKAEIDALLAMPNVDITALQSAIAQIQSLLDAEPGTEGFQVGQNIITTLTDLTARVTALENDTVVATLQTLVNSLSVDLASEINRAQTAEAALQDQIDTLSASLATLQTTAANLPESQACDCAALQAQITALGNSVTNLQSADAAFAVQITALQDSVAALTTQLASVSATATAAASAAALAQGAAATAQAGVATNAAAIQALDAREAAANASATARLTELESFKDNMLATNCVALRAAFTNGISLGKVSGY